MTTARRLVAVFAVFLLAPSARAAERPPNILFAISDDQSWLHAGAYGDRCVKTPAFDRIASRCVRFNHAYVACSSCTPSRSAILTGQTIWRLEAGGVLWSELPSKFEVFPRLLEEAGYFIGHTGKAWGPGSYRAGGWDRPPSGRRYAEHRARPPRSGIHPMDYAANFQAFLKDRPKSRPFCFWFGTYEPHRAYAKGAGVAAGKRWADARLPGALPDAPETRGDVLDYYPLHVVGGSPDPPTASICGGAVGRSGDRPTTSLLQTTRKPNPGLQISSLELLRFHKCSRKVLPSPILHVGVA